MWEGACAWSRGSQCVGGGAVRWKKTGSHRLMEMASTFFYFFNSFLDLCPFLSGLCCYCLE